MPQPARLFRSGKSLLEAVLCLGAVVLGGAQAWSCRYDFASEDIVSYLDVADSYLRGDWGSVINGNWSPLYSWLLGLAQAVLHVPASRDACRVKLVNFAIFLFALGCFRFFLHALLRLHRERLDAAGRARSRSIPEWVLAVAGYALFLRSALHWTGLYCDTPDLCTGGLVYLACGLVLRLQRRPEGRLGFVALGAVLGLGYLSKAAMFPLALVVLPVAALPAGGLRAALPRLGLGLLSFALVAGPYVAALSLARGRLTFSETGKLSYAWWVNPGMSIIGDHHWQGGPAENGTPLHPTRRVFADPELYEFAQPLGGTFPPWTDPSYWYEGLRVRFRWDRQWAMVAQNAGFYFQTFLKVLLIGFAALACAGGRPGASLRGLAAGWKVAAVALAGLGMYMLSTDFVENTMIQQPSTRFIAPFIVVLSAAALAGVRLARSGRVRGLVTALVCAGVVFAGGRIYYCAAAEIRAELRERKVNSHWQVAEGLAALGIRPGDRVAIIGEEYLHEFWARLARVKIVAQAPNAEAFWAKDESVRAAVLQSMRATGARAVVLPAPFLPPGAQAGWQQAGGAPYVAYFFQP